jgi:tRNA dimethylallyltransferase
MAIPVEKPPVVLIAGPTASGKSALALQFAEQFEGVIVNADSAQIYREIPILSAAPGADEISRVEHRLYGILDGAQACSAAEWAELAKREIKEIHLTGRVPVIVGGTGLYLRTLLDGIAPIPPIESEVRKKVRETSVGANRACLQDLDPEAAERLQPGDRSRIARALEVVVSTGKTLAEWQGELEGGISDGIDLKPIILLPPRNWLYDRCDERFAKMIEAGAAEEVGALLERRLDPALPVMRAIGVREIAPWLRGDVTLEEAIAAGQQSTRRYAKRQYTWFAHQPPANWQRFRKPLDADSMKAALALLMWNP